MSNDILSSSQQVLNDESFAILVLMALFTTFITTPTVMAIYKPARRTSALTRRKLRDLSNASDSNSKDEFRVLACFHGPGNVSSLISLVEATRSTKKQLKLFIMHLVELTERSSSIIMAYGQLGRVSVRPTTAISPLATMHEDICYVAEDKRVTMIILPFHKRWRGEGDESMENLGHGWPGVNQRVLKHAPCSVGLLVDRGFSISCLFGVLLCILTFVLEQMQELDEIAVGEFMSKWDGVADCVDKVTSNIVEGVLTIGRSGEFDLIVVGKGRFPSSMVAKLVDRQAELAELGPIGDILASSGQGVFSSVLVVQQHDKAHAEEMPVTKIGHSDYVKFKGDELSGAGEISKAV
ncbi:hypothetical protein Patl1_31908 [Pistacia atlantica]|uniref:Uncharacterized protein n=1 Tax=Pistacia atlantica TaxID=434234 RepID=A0ACC1ANA7_9ROSI|nr:hypothetical protein Patl1_31908 [Pistacia atlantica]